MWNGHCHRGHCYKNQTRKGTNSKKDKFFCLYFFLSITYSQYGSPRCIFLVSEKVKFGFRLSTAPSPHPWWPELQKSSLKPNSFHLSCQGHLFALPTHLSSVASTISKSNSGPIDVIASSSVTSAMSLGFSVANPIVSANLFAPFPA